VIGSVELAILGLWWTILGAALAKWRKLQSIFVGPFGISLKRKWILIFLLAGLALMVLSVWAAYLFDRRVWFSI
jgi:hypothetical protein